jgi:polysaccharide biosynthesis protein PslG
VALALPAASAAKPTPTTVPAYGLNALRAEWLADFRIGIDDLGRMGSNKIGLYRARFRQDQVLSGGTYSNWSRLDNLAKQASLQGVALVPILMNMPGDTYTPPHTSTERDQFGSFAAAAARRYGPKGSFWTSCGCPFRPVQVWEVWNEPNMAPYWDAPNAVDYAGMLQVVRSKVRAVDPAARIMVGGLAYAGSYDGVSRINPNDFLRTVIQTNGANAFDALALHDYHSNATSGVNAIGGTVGILKQYAGTDGSGAPRQQVWINEFGKATALDDPSTPGVNEAAQSEITQRDWLNAFLDGLLANRSGWSLGPTFWYSIRDDQNPNAAWLRLGLRRTNSDDTDGGPKLAWDAYVARSGVAPPLPLPVVR